MDAINSYLAHVGQGSELDRLLASQRILFCCQSRLLATLWVRAERGRNSVNGNMPGHLAGACTRLDEALEVCREQQPNLLITTQLLESGSGLELVVEAKRIQPELRSLISPTVSKEVRSV